MTATDTPAKASNAAFWFIFASTLINALSFGIMIPVQPNLIKQFLGGDTASASTWNVLFSTTWGVLQLFCGPVLGMLSDRFGRRPVLLISMFGMFVDYLILALAPSLWWLYLGRILSGMTAASFSTANAYVADVTPPARRARNFGILGAAFGMGFMIGPWFGAELGHINLRAPFYLAAGLCLVNGLYGLFVLPESLAREHRSKTLNWRKANPVGSLALLRSRPDLLGLAGVGFLYQLSQVALPTVMVLYAGYRYGWSLSVLGWVFMGSGASMILVQMFLVAPIVKRFGERGSVLMGASLGGLGMVIYGLAASPQLYWLAIPVFAFGGLLQPGLQALMTQRVGPQFQGQLQGANQSLQGISTIIGTPLFGLSFAWAVRQDSRLHMSGLPFLIAGFLLFAALTLASQVARRIDV